MDWVISEMKGFFAALPYVLALIFGLGFLCGAGSCAVAQHVDLDLDVGWEK